MTPEDTAALSAEVLDLVGAARVAASVVRGGQGGVVIEQLSGALRRLDLAMAKRRQRAAMSEARVVTTRADGGAIDEVEVFAFAPRAYDDTYAADAALKVPTVRLRITRGDGGLTAEFIEGPAGDWCRLSKGPLLGAPDLIAALQALSKS